jgi:hypothetical protein
MVSYAPFSDNHRERRPLLSTGFASRCEVPTGPEGGALVSLQRKGIVIFGSFPLHPAPSVQAGRDQHTTTTTTTTNPMLRRRSRLCLWVGKTPGQGEVLPLAPGEGRLGLPRSSRGSLALSAGGSGIVWKTTKTKRDQRAGNGPVLIPSLPVAPHPYGTPFSRSYAYSGVLRGDASRAAALCAVMC